MLKMNTTHKLPGQMKVKFIDLYPHCKPKANQVRSSLRLSPSCHVFRHQTQDWQYSWQFDRLFHVPKARVAGAFAAAQWPRDSRRSSVVPRHHRRKKPSRRCRDLRTCGEENDHGISVLSLSERFHHILVRGVDHLFHLCSNYMRSWLIRGQYFAMQV